MSDKKQVIYTVTTVDEEAKPNRVPSRCWGWFPDESSAVEAAQRPGAFYPESGYFRWIVVEEIPAGVSWDIREVAWFEVVRVEGNRFETRRLETKPAQYELTAAFGMG